MIAFLKGTLVAKDADGIVIEVAGVGYAVGMSATSLSALPETGETVLVHTYLQVRDDALALYGFTSTREKHLFEELITVSGVGPKVALAALSTYGPDALASAITAQDIAAVSRIPGIGKKTAQRIILELKGTLEADTGGMVDAGGAADAARKGTAEALLSMGFTSAEVDLALKDAPEGAAEAVLLQYALKRLGE